MVPIRRSLASVATAVLLPLIGCSNPSSSSPADGEAPLVEVVVFAASSLTAAFSAIGDAYVADHPNVKLVFNFAGSSELVRQLAQGAPADIFASADQATMDALVRLGEARNRPVTIARNTLEIVVERGNPLEINELSDLANRDLIVVLCAPAVPCGKSASAVLDRAGVRVTPRSLETSVKGVLTKVTTGEADAGIVYTTDVLAASETASGVAIDGDVNEITSYPMVVTAGTRNEAAAQTFIDFVVGEQGQAILRSQGFLAP